MAYQTTNPFSGKILQTFPSMTDAELEAGLAIADSSFATWRNVSFADRAAICRKAAAMEILAGAAGTTIRQGTSPASFRKTAGMTDLSTRSIVKGRSDAPETKTA
jgi:hypothetical protein